MTWLIPKREIIFPLCLLNREVSDMSQLQEKQPCSWLLNCAKEHFSRMNVDLWKVEMNNVMFLIILCVLQFLNPSWSSMWSCSENWGGLCLLTAGKNTWLRWGLYVCVSLRCVWLQIPFRLHLTLVNITYWRGSANCKPSFPWMECLLVAL